MIDSAEYNETFGEDTVPYERFITPTDLSTRRVPALRRPFDAGSYVDLSPSRRPLVPQPQQIRTVSGDPVRRNLPAPPPPARGGWSAAISGGESFAAPVSSAPAGSQSLRQAPSPQRRWQDNGSAAVGAWTSTVTATPVRPTGATPAGLAAGPIQGSWRSTVSSGAAVAQAQQAGAAMVKALMPGTPQGFRRRQSLGSPLKLAQAPSRAEVDAVIAATYRQLLNREPLQAERLGDAESQLRDGQVSVAEFVSLLACSDLFQARLDRLAPLRGAAAAHLALLGRAATPAETSRYLSTRVRQGQRAAIQQILVSRDYAMAFGMDTVPYLRGLQTANGIPLTTVNRTAALYGGNAGLNPAIKGAV
jgi:phycobilisome core-membrane linker protein